MTTFAEFNAVFDSKLPPIPRFVLVALVDHLPNCEPSIARLANRTGLSDRAIRLALGMLEKLGVISVRRCNGKRSSYGVNLEALTPAPHTAVPDAAVSRTAVSHAGHPGTKCRPTPAPRAAKVPIEVPREVLGQPNPVPGTPPSKAQRTTRKARLESVEESLPSTWIPTQAHGEFANKHGLDLELEAIKFRGHAEAKGRLAKSWNGAFTTWLGNAVSFAAERPARPSTRSAEVDHTGGYQ